MASFNKVILVGNLTRDPELRYTPKGTAVARLGLAVNRQWKTDTGEAREEVTFIDIDAFGRQAEVIGQYCKKGRPLMIEGRLKYEQWDDKQTNQKRSKLMVVLESFQFLGDGNRGGGEGAPAGAPAARKPAPAGEAPAPADSEGPPLDDDVPF
jgi:single-strand DNA-binding protein